jgi:hypothetical protein
MIEKGRLIRDVPRLSLGALDLLEHVLNGRKEVGVEIGAAVIDDDIWVR